MSSRLLTSTPTLIAEPPAAVIPRSTSASASALRAARTTFAPRLAASLAVARPMPLDAPVTTMT